MEYEDLVIQLGTGAAGTYTVRMARSPAGETDPEPLSAPVSADEIDHLAQAFRRAARDVKHAVPLEISAPALTDIGDRLFRALFPEAIRNRYHESLGRIGDRGSSGLRLRIQMGLGIPDMTLLHSIPWEYLHSTAAGHFLALDRRTSIVRYLDLGMVGDRPPASPPLAILAVDGEDPSLDLARERRAIEQAWLKQGEVRLTLLRQPTLDSLREELLARDYHVLHFMGHGGFDPLAGEGSIAIHDEEGRRLWVNGSALAEQVRGLSSLRLIVLNACWTARANSSGPYAGVATAVLRAGIPAVVAMQFPITNRAALAFSRCFYRRLARGDTIDEAVTEGRMAIRRADGASHEWGTPVLFERLTRGQVVEARQPRWRHAAAAGSVILACFLLIWLGLRGIPAGRGSQPANQQTADGSGSPRLSTPAPRSSAEATVKRRTPPPAAPRIYKLTAAKPVFVEELDTSVAAEFFKLGRVPYATLHVTPPHGPANLAMVRPASSDEDLQVTNQLVVLGVDWSEQSMLLCADLPPEGATAQCRDGFWSFSHTRGGTCSQHRGVGRRLQRLGSPP